MNKLLEIKNISKSFHTLNGEINAIGNISFSIDEGEFISIVGKSGCGKSTLLSIISGLEKKDSGSITSYLEKPTIGYMLQDDALFPHYNILNNVLLGLKIQNRCDDKAINYAKELLKKYGLEDFIYKYPNELSGGMKQRVALIRTIVLNPDILLLDEPFSALDFNTRLEVSNDIFNIIKDFNISTIMVTHDIAEAISMSDIVLVLSKSPAVIKNKYEINLDNKDIPTKNRKDKYFNYYYDLIWEDLKNE